MLEKKLKEKNHGKKLLEGLIKRHPDGFGFFIPDDSTHPDVYVPKSSMTGVMTQDRVLLSVERERGGDRFRGEIIRILSRGTQRVVGAYSRLNEQYFGIKDEGKGWGEDLRVKGDTKNAKTGDLVTIEITQYPEEGRRFEGKIVEVLGKMADPLNDIKRVIVANNIPHEFPAAVLAEASKFGKNPTEEDFKNRKDLRAHDLITIDGATAKDFDDAVCTELDNNGFHLFVAIADVSHYVRQGTALDKEAFERGTSVYFPNFVVPMLPEELSNGLCSLNPHVPRLSLVAEMWFDFQGNMTKSDFYEAVIESKARVTYGEAQEVVDGNPMPKLDHVKDNILRCADLAKLLMAKRFREGSLDLEIPESELEIDSAGVPVDVIRSERLFAHRLIEELMLAANVAVAKFLSSRDIPSMYRIHEPPNEKALNMLELYIHNFGGKSKFDGGKLQKKLTRALQDFEGKPESGILHILTLRSMSQAKYHMNNVGHFGLGFDFYTHFTSPIRRYPDLIVHRLIKNQIMPNSPYRLMREEDLLTAGTMLSAAEQRSAKAERQVQSIKKARFMEKFVGECFEGMISSVTRFGIFVLLRQYDIDGLVRLDDLGNDRWQFDEEKLQLVGERSGFIYTIGDKINIQVASCDYELGQINFILDPSVELKNGPPKKKAPRTPPLKAEPEKFVEGLQKQKTNERKQGKSLLDFILEKGAKNGVSHRKKSSAGKDSKKRRKAQDDRGGVRKARPSKPSRKNRSR